MRHAGNFIATLTAVTSILAILGVLLFGLYVIAG
jgi:hypothetical protein